MSEFEEIREGIEREAQRIEEDCKYSSKGHFNAAAYWKSVHYWIGIPAAVLAAAASGTAFGDQSFIAGLIGILVTVLAALATFLDPSGKKNSHQAAGGQYLTLKNRARLFRETELQRGDVDDLLQRIEEMSERRNELNEASPSIPRQAFEKAREGIESGEADYEADKIKNS